MTPLETQMGAAVSAALSCNPEDARQYATDAKMVARGVLGPQGKMMTMAADTAEAFAAFCEALAVVVGTFNTEQEG